MDEPPVLWYDCGRHMVRYELEPVQLDSTQSADTPSKYHCDLLKVKTQ